RPIIDGAFEVADVGIGAKDGAVLLHHVHDLTARRPVGQVDDRVDAGVATVDSAVDGATRYVNDAGFGVVRADGAILDRGASEFRQGHYHHIVPEIASFRVVGGVAEKPPQGVIGPGNGPQTIGVVAVVRIRFDLIGVSVEAAEFRTSNDSVSIGQDLGGGL